MEINYKQTAYLSSKLELKVNMKSSDVCMAQMQEEWRRNTRENQNIKTF
jgi:hypothetical protein